MNPKIMTSDYLSGLDVRFIFYLLKKYIKYTFLYFILFIIILYLLEHLF